MCFVLVQNDSSQQPNEHAHTLYVSPPTPTLLKKKQQEINKTLTLMSGRFSVFYVLSI